MRIDGHVHMSGEEKDSDRLMGQLKKAGFDGAIIFSPAPNGMLGKTATSEKRLEQLLTFTKGQETLYPFFFIDPTEEDAMEQARAAKEAGVAGFKIICNHFYPGDECVMELCQWIAKQEMPLMFHSGILYDGINVSGKYNRPCEFEPLLSIEGLRFSIAHLSWPWTGEAIAVFGKFDCYLKNHPDGKAARMYLDLTPGTPPTFREEAMRHTFTNDFRVEECTFWGSDNTAGNYDYEYAKRILERDIEIFDKLELSEQLKSDILYGNCMRFLKS